MKLVNALATTLILILVQTYPRVRAQQAGNTRDGLATAQAFCSECHAILKGGAHSPNPRAPTFVEIANSPGITAAALLVAVTTPHAGMPMFVLTAQQRSNIITYVLSLKEK